MLTWAGPLKVHPKYIGLDMYSTARDELSRRRRRRKKSKFSRDMVSESHIIGGLLGAKTWAARNGRSVWLGWRRGRPASPVEWQ